MFFTHIAPLPFFQYITAQVQHSIGLNITTTNMAALENR
jgi:hypothetical protein